MGWSQEELQGSGSQGFEYDFTVYKAHFGYHAQYNEGKTPLLILEGEKDWGEGPQDGHLFVKIGSFEPGDDEGTFAVTEDGKDAVFHNRSHIQEFIRTAAELGWPSPAEKGFESSRQAGIWVGSKFRIGTQERSFKSRESGDQVKYEIALPIAYLGEVEVAGSAGAAVSAKANVKAKLAARQSAKAKTDDVAEKLAELAAQSEEYLDFLEAATSELGLEVDDARLEEEGKASVWAQVKAEA